jgi:chromosome segregation ATPase
MQSFNNQNSSADYIDLLNKNKDLEEEIVNLTTRVNNLNEIKSELESQLSGLKKLESELKDVVKKYVCDSKTFKDQSDRISSLLLKIKARDVELNILKNERGDVHKLKEELTEAKRTIAEYDINLVASKIIELWKNNKDSVSFKYFCLYSNIFYVAGVQVR